MYTYKRRFLKQQETRRWAGGLSLTLGARLSHRFNEQWQADLVAAHKAHWPRRKVIKTANLPEDIQVAIQLKWQNRAMYWLTKTVALNTCLNAWLDANAHLVQVELLPEVQVLRTSSTSTYNSQGSGSYKYAKQALSGDLDLLLAAGVTATIVEVKASYGAEYHLMGNCAPYVLDALQRRSTETLLEWAIKQWRNGVNPAVYYPFLPNDIYEKSLANWQVNT